MTKTNILEGKRILIVDDEPDVLESLIEILSECKIDTANSFEDGKKMLETRQYDIAVLDIMGVQGFDLLEISTRKGIPAFMLTAHALTPDSLEESAKSGAVYFAPKETMSEIDMQIADVLEALDSKKSPWEKLVERLGGFYDRKFKGPHWREQEKEFLKKHMENFY